MTIPLFPLLAVFLLATTSYSQTNDEEIANLRAHLGLPDSIRFELADTPNIPKAENLRLFIATGLDVVTRSNLRGWIGRWAQKKEKRYGHIEIVDDIQDADVILARYVIRGQTTARLDAKLWGPYPDVETSTLAPVWAYIIRRDGGEYSVLWRYTTLTSFDDTKQNGELLFKGLATFLEQKERRLK